MLRGLPYVKYEKYFSYKCDLNIITIPFKEHDDTSYTNEPLNLFEKQPEFIRKILTEKICYEAGSQYNFNYSKYLVSPANDKDHSFIESSFLKDYNNILLFSSIDSTSTMTYANKNLFPYKMNTEGIKLIEENSTAELIEQGKASYYMKDFKKFTSWEEQIDPKGFLADLTKDLKKHFSQIDMYCSNHAYRFDEYCDSSHINKMTLVCTFKDNSNEENANQQLEIIG